MKKRIGLIVLSAALLLSNTTFASSANLYSYPPSTTIGQSLNGEHIEIKPDSRTYPKESEIPKDRTKRSSFIVYEKDGMVEDSIECTYAYSRKTDRDREFFRTGIHLPKNSGAVWDYEWSTTVEKKNYSEHDFKIGVKGKYEGWIVGELEGEVGYEYTNGSEIVRKEGKIERLHLDGPGEYTITWYMVADVYKVYADWYAYTRDNPDKRIIAKRRYIGKEIIGTPYTYTDIDYEEE